MSPEGKTEQKCICKDCTNRGTPTDGFAFFACNDCLEKLSECLELEYRKRIQRHYNN